MVEQKSSGEEDTWEDELPAHRIRAWRAISAVRLQDKGWNKRGVFLQTPVMIENISGLFLTIEVQERNPTSLDLVSRGNQDRKETQIRSKCGWPRGGRGPRRRRAAPGRRRPAWPGAVGRAAPAFGLLAAGRLGVVRGRLAGGEGLADCFDLFGLRLRSASLRGDESVAAKYPGTASCRLAVALSSNQMIRTGMSYPWASLYHTSPDTSP